MVIRYIIKINSIIKSLVKCQSWILNQTGRRMAPRLIVEATMTKFVWLRCWRYCRWPGQRGPGWRSRRPRLIRGSARTQPDLALFLSVRITCLISFQKMMMINSTLELLIIIISGHSNNTMTYALQETNRMSVCWYLSGKRPSYRN